jgi:hypothetical protein
MIGKRHEGIEVRVFLAESFLHWPKSNYHFLEIQKGYPYSRKLLAISSLNRKHCTKDRKDMPVMCT